jgi:hypothetical protein
VEIAAHFQELGMATESALTNTELPSMQVIVAKLPPAVLPTITAKDGFVTGRSAALQ